MGLSVCGYDLNPVMIAVAQARCLDPAEYSSLKPLAADIGHKDAECAEMGRGGHGTNWRPIFLTSD